MKGKLILLIVILSGCQSSKKKESGFMSELPVIDVSKNYPEKIIRLQDIADIE